MTQSKTNLKGNREQFCTETCESNLKGRQLEHCEGICKGVVRSQEPSVPVDKSDANESQKQFADEDAKKIDDNKWVTNCSERKPCPGVALMVNHQKVSEKNLNRLVELQKQKFDNKEYDDKEAEGYCPTVKTLLNKHILSSSKILQSESKKGNYYLGTSENKENESDTWNWKCHSRKTCPTLDTVLNQIGIKLSDLLQEKTQSSYEEKEAESAEKLKATETDINENEAVKTPSKSGCGKENKPAKKLIANKTGDTEELNKETPDSSSEKEKEPADVSVAETNADKVEKKSSSYHSQKQEEPVEVQHAPEITLERKSKPKLCLLCSKIKASKNKAEKESSRSGSEKEKEKEKEIVVESKSKPKVCACSETGINENKVQKDPSGSGSGSKKSKSSETEKQEEVESIVAKDSEDKKIDELGEKSSNSIGSTSDLKKRSSSIHSFDENDDANVMIRWKKKCGEGVYELENLLTVCENNPDSVIKNLKTTLGVDKEIPNESDEGEEDADDISLDKCFGPEFGDPEYHFLMVNKATSVSMLETSDSKELSTGMNEKDVLTQEMEKLRGASANYGDSKTSQRGSDVHPESELKDDESDESDDDDRRKHQAKRTSTVSWRSVHTQSSESAASLDQVVKDATAKADNFRQNLEIKKQHSLLDMVKRRETIEKPPEEPKVEPTPHKRKKFFSFSQNKKPNPQKEKEKEKEPDKNEGKDEESDSS